MPAGVLFTEQRSDGVEFSAAGSWTAEYADRIESQMDAAIAGIVERGVTINAAHIENLDTYGAWLIERAIRTLTRKGGEARLVGLRDDYRGLFEKVHVGTQVLSSPPPRPNSIVATLESVGRTMASVGADLVLLAEMLGLLIVALQRVVRRPKSFRFTSMIHQIERVAWRAVPIILLITVLIGAILAQQGIFHFRKFGADIYVIDMVGVLVLREIGVLIVCIMVAGRSGSSYTAELGTMRMREEVDALRTMGFDPIEVLILPRILALVIAVPILTFLGSMAALYGGGLVAWLYGGIQPEVFLDRLREAVTTTTFEVGMIKAPFMALLIGIVACVEGLQVGGSAESLGEKTTNSVVKSIFLVIVLDGVFAMFFASIGM
ncbi:MAG TPA: ABC transporter permease [Bradyrhizobium sp.]|nr:ABC transporter permease [Bradyrhizobium sp.]HKO70412.1 ABC transporter permease [Bradyrhizobium sp.]